MKGFVLKGDYISIDGFEITNDAAGANGIDAGQTHMKNAREGCRFVNNCVHEIKGTAIVSGTHALVKGNTMRNVGRGMYINSHSLAADNEVDPLMVQMVTKKGETKPKKTQYAFFAGESITFRGNYFHGAPEEHLMKGMGVDCFVTWDAWIIGPSHHILIENNRCFNATHASEVEALKLKKSSHITYRNNLFVNTVYVGVYPKGWSNITVENNTFINCGAYPIWFRSARETEGTTVRNNLIAYWKRDRVVKAFGWTPSESGIANQVLLEGKSHASFVCDYNMFFDCKNRGYGKNDFTAEPQFMDPDNNDFRLKPGSPGVDAGMDLPAVKTDRLGVTRPQGKAFDIGAYELKQAAK